MRMRGLMMLGLALVIAIVAVFLARNLILSRGDRPVVVQQADTQLASVVVSRARLDFAARLGPEHVQVVKWPSEAIPPGTFRSIEELFKPGVERVVLRSIEQGEPIFAVKISGAGQRATLSALVDKEMRAVSIRVNDVTEVAGFILPGDRVDVLLTRDEGGSGPAGMINDVMLQNLRVLGVDQQASDRQDKPIVVKAVTLEASPVQAQKLTLAAQVGTLTLVLRNEADSDPGVHRQIRVADLRGGEMVRPLPDPDLGAGRLVRAARPTGDGTTVISVTSIKIVRAMKASTQGNVAKEKPAVETRKANKPATVRPTDLQPPSPDEDTPGAKAKPSDASAPEAAGAIQVVDRVGEEQ